MLSPPFCEHGIIWVNGVFRKTSCGASLYPSYEHVSLWNREFGVPNISFAFLIPRTLFLRNQTQYITQTRCATHTLKTIQQSFGFLFNIHHLSQLNTTSIVRLLLSSRIPPTPFSKRGEEPLHSDTALPRTHTTRKINYRSFHRLVELPLPIELNNRGNILRYPEESISSDE